VAHDSNVIGPTVSKLRYQRGWKQDDLVAKLQLVGCYMTRDIVANIETRRSPVTDIQIEFLCQVFSVKVQDLFPVGAQASLLRNTRLLGLAHRIVTRRCRSRGRPKRDRT
jgi:transcriptional regulator with XRE-family HTH domain